MSSPSSSTPPAPPTSQQIQQSLHHLASLSSLLDSSTWKAADDTLQPHPPGSRFPGLVDILPHLLAPLTDLTRLQAVAASTDSRTRGTEASAAKKALVPLLPTAKIQSSPSLATYRPLTAQVSSILSQIIQGVSDDKGQGVREAIRIAEDVLQSQGGKRGREGDGLSRDERREIVLNRRKKRRARERLNAEASRNEALPVASSSSPHVPKTLSFDALTRTFVSTVDDAGRQSDNSPTVEEIGARIKTRLDNIRKHYRAFDSSQTEQIIDPTVSTQTQKEKVRLWLAQIVAEDSKSVEPSGTPKLCRGIVRIRLPGVGDGLAWFECESNEKGWYSNVTKVNLRTSTEMEGEIVLKTKGISHAHLPSSSPMLRELTLHLTRHISSSPSSHDPLSSVTHTVLRILSLRTLSKPPPPSLEQLSLSRMQDEQLKLLTGVEMCTANDKETSVGVAGWLDSKMEEDGAADSVGVKWAWCLKEGDESGDGGQWLAFVG